jgi:hypothetical protein
MTELPEKSKVGAGGTAQEDEDSGRQLIKLATVSA